jgi:hypothetical protein
VLAGTIFVTGAAAGFPARLRGAMPGRSGAPSCAQNFALERFTNPHRGQISPTARTPELTAGRDAGAGATAGCAATDDPRADGDAGALDE